MSQLEPMMAEENKNCTALPSLSLLLGSGCVFQDVCRIKTRGALPTQLVHLRGGGSCAIVSESTQFQTPIFVWGKRIMVKIEGTKKITIN